MKRILLLLSIVGLSLFHIAQAQQLAFPGAEGFGKYAKGGRGGKVLTVSTLQDYLSAETPIVGSLRWALSQYVTTQMVDKAGIPTAVTVYEPLTIVFSVSGTIWLKEDLKIKRDYLTIAGQTAPGDGICIAGRSCIFNGATGGEMFYWGPQRRDLIVRHIRFRSGIPRDATGTPTNAFVTYGLDMENYRNAIFDHCTMSWANEECLATYDTKNVTIQWCMVYEGLFSAYHKKGLRSYGGVWGGQYASFHHNLVAHQHSRTVRFNGSRAHDTIAVIDYHNNVVYNWGDSEGAYGNEIYEATNTYVDSLGKTRTMPNITKKMTSTTGKIYYPALGKAEVNLINNYYKAGPATPATKASRLLYFCDKYDPNYPDKEVGQAYVAGNYIYGNATATADNWSGGLEFKFYPANMASLFKLDAISAEVIPELPSAMESAETALTAVLNGAGATLPLRDAQDKRIAAEALGGTAVGYGTMTGTIYTQKVKGIIDDPAVVGGWPTLTTGTVPADTDADGMPDSWETANTLNPNDAADGNFIAGNGYTNLENYLNGITQFQNFLQAPFNLKGSMNGSSQPSLTWQDVSESETGYEIQRAPFGTTTFETIATIANNSTTYTDLTAGTNSYIYKVRATTASLTSEFSNSVTVGSGTAINNANYINIQILPNPVKDNFSIIADEKIESVQVTNANGIVVSSFSAQEQYNISSLKNGIYFVKVVTLKGEQAIEKLIKE